MKHFGGPILSFCYSILNEGGSIGGQIANNLLDMKIPDFPVASLIYT